MILSIDYSYRYRLQPIVLIIGPITRMAVISAQLYAGHKNTIKKKVYTKT